MTAQLDTTSFLYAGNSAFIEALYAKYSADPNSVDASWRQLFEALGDDPSLVQQSAKGPSWQPKISGLFDEEGLLGPGGKAEKAAKRAQGTGADARQAAMDTIRAAMLIRNYRIRGHLKAKLDPLGLEPPGQHPELRPESYGFTEADMDRPIFIDFMLGLETATLREILQILERTYCSTIGFEFMHIYHPEQKAWIQERIEGRDKEISFTPEGKKAILNKLIEAEHFERFCQIKYTTTKRFGLEGGEALIPAMEAIIKRGGQLGVIDIELGMPHRGRLNVLANVMSKPYRAIFGEFQGASSTPDDVQGSGDVKYHLGSSSDREFDGNKVHLSLAANPSHLEAVDPVVLGKARAKQAQLSDHSLARVGQLTDADRSQVMAVLLHGDAAFAGQGIVAECFALADLRGYRTGGTIHIIVNNQIGFTTAPKYSRSSPYPSDLAKGFQAPIFHVNGDDPEAVTFACKVATEFRQKFLKDVVVDMFCYRRHGHNETDEPSFTQPLMYRKIATHPTTRQIYAKRLAEEGLVSEAESEAMLKAFHDRLETEFEAAKSYKINKADWLEGRWAGFKTAPDDDRRGTTGVALDTLKQIGLKLTEVPQGLNVHRTLQRIIAAKRKTIEDGEGLDWATGESLAFGSLVLEGTPVRLSGQDCGRGTFSQRHSVWVDQQSEERYLPLNNLKADQPAFYEVHDSLLSEYAVLGYEYGYSMAEPKALTLWEAQFGDFANGAQIMFDQFIATGESKWLRMSGLVMLLPHGFEGQGPEHSSARLERFLQLSAGDNWQVLNCTTPANYFHALRRQIHRDFRKPLVIVTPKSLLKHRLATSKLSEMAAGTSFHRVLDDIGTVDEKKVKRVVLCSGKVYYDLHEKREELGLKDVYILRVEQLYPFPKHVLATYLERFPKAEKIVWCQEEPANMGAWFFVEPRIEESLARAKHKVKRPVYAGRTESASPATGLHRLHVREQAALVEQALVG